MLNVCFDPARPCSSFDVSTLQVDQVRLIFRGREAILCLAQIQNIHVLGREIRTIPNFGHESQNIGRKSRKIGRTQSKSV